MNGIWDWASNKENVINFFREGIKREAPYEHVWTMGMRGLGDTASRTLTPAQLEEILVVQQELLKEGYNRTTLDGIPMMWCLYKVR